VSTQPARKAPSVSEAALAAACKRLMLYSNELDQIERPAPGEYDVTADIRLVVTATRELIKAV